MNCKIDIVHTLRCKDDGEATLYCGRKESYKRKWQVYAGLGNPHNLGHCRTCGKLHSRGEAILAYENDLLFAHKLPNHIKTIKQIARRIVEQPYTHIQLACFCAPRACHCSIIRQQINKEIERVENNDQG